MRTGKQSIYDEDLGENQTWFFYTDGSNKGRGYHGIRDNSVYRQGLRLSADRDLKYAPVELDWNFLSGQCLRSHPEGVLFL